MSDPKARPLWLDVAAVYLLVIGGLMILGVAAENAWDVPVRGDALDIGSIWVALLAVVCLTAALGLLVHENWGRLLFVVLTPLASIGLARVFSQNLWELDVPYSALLVFVHVPLVFALARRDALGACGREESTWRARGGVVALGCVVVAGGLRLWVPSTKPAGGGGFLAQGAALEQYVARLASADVLLWSYVGALIAVSIPSGHPREAAKAAAPFASAASAWLWWLVATAVGVVIGEVFYESVLRSTWPERFRTLPGEATGLFYWTAQAAAAGVLWGVSVAGLQSIVLRRRGLGLRWWTLVGALGWGLTWVVSVVLIPYLVATHVDEDEWFDVLLSPLCPLGAGLIVVTLQWVLLRKVVPRAWLWIPGAALAHALGMFGAMHGIWFLWTWRREGFFAELGYDVIFSFLHGLILGALSGLLLVWMSRGAASPGRGAETVPAD